MALSEYEKQVLEQMEAELRRADPKLSSEMSADHPEVAPARPGSLSPRRIAAGSVLALAGLGVVLVGVSLGHTGVSIGLGVLGFAMMVSGVLLALRATPTGTRLARGQRKAGGAKGWRRFIADQERRWDQRDDG